LRHSSVTGTPAYCSRRICSSVNLDRSIRPSLSWGGLQLFLAEFQGITSAAFGDGRLSGFICAAGFRLEAICRKDQAAIFQQPYMGGEPIQRRSS
jgi:hypothetical protein